MTKNHPIRFEFPDKPFTLEIQHLIAPSDLNKSDLDNPLFALAINTDDHKLLMDLSDNNLSILQKEFEGLDFIDVTLSDLLGARIIPL